MFTYIYTLLHHDYICETTRLFRCINDFAILMYNKQIVYVLTRVAVDLIISGRVESVQAKPPVRQDIIHMYACHGRGNRGLSIDHHITM